jgi:hypothetical protein
MKVASFAVYFEDRYVDVDSKAWNSKDFGAWWRPREFSFCTGKNGSKICDALSTFGGLVVSIYLTHPSEPNADKPLLIVWFSTHRFAGDDDWGMVALWSIFSLRPAETQQL